MCGGVITKGKKEGRPNSVKFICFFHGEVRVVGPAGGEGGLGGGPTGCVRVLGRGEEVEGEEGKRGGERRRREEEGGGRREGNERKEEKEAWEEVQRAE
jgi:hypothetical protein